MLGVAFALLAGCLIGLLRGGSFRRLESVRLERVPLVFVALGVQIAAGALEFAGGGHIALGLTLAAYAGIGWFAVSNRRLIGMPVLAVGALLNFIAIAVNNGMPVSDEALHRAGLPDPYVGKNGAVIRAAHHVLTSHDRLRFLTDVIPLKYGTVVSVGDLLIWSGIILLVQHLVVGPRGRHGRAPVDRADGASAQEDAAARSPSA
jgi:hypothetical protein